MTSNQAQKRNEGAEGLEKPLNLAGKFEQSKAVLGLNFLRSLKLWLGYASEGQSAGTRGAQALSDLVRQIGVVIEHFGNALSQQVLRR